MSTGERRACSDVLLRRTRADPPTCPLPYPIMRACLTVRTLLRHAGAGLASSCGRCFAALACFTALAMLCRVGMPRAVTPLPRWLARCAVRTLLVLLRRALAGPTDLLCADLLEEGKKDFSQ